MMSLISALCIDVYESFYALVQATHQLADSVLTDKDLINWVGDDKCPRERANEVYGQFQYHDGQDPREIVVCAGFLGASAETLKLAIAVNQAKEHFKQCMLALKAAKIPISDPALTEKFEKLLNARAQNVSITLKRMGLGRLHLKQCYRKIPILNAAPVKIRWTWANTRSIKKISVSQAQQMLQKRGTDSGIQVQLQKLYQLPEKETLAIIQELAPHLRTNILFDENSPQQRLMIKGPLPILFPCSKETPCPDFKAPREKSAKNENRVIRSDVKLDPNVFLPAIRAHRYLKS